MSISKILFAFICFLLGLASYGQVSGCTDSLADNYNPSATDNDGSCVYPEVSIAAFQMSNLPEVLDDNSGLLFYRDSLMSFNDHGDANLYLFPPDQPEAYRNISLSGFTPVDWEEMAADSEYFYIGDFGNNIHGSRTDLRIYRFLKNELDTAPVLESFPFSYELQTDFTPTDGVNQTDFDAEAFVVTEDRIFIFTKEWLSHKTSVYELEKSPTEQVANFKGEWDVEGLITGASFFESEKLLVLSGYSSLLQPFVYLLYDFKGTDFFSGNKRKIKIDLPLHQVEGIASLDGLEYYIANEGLHEVVFGQEIDVDPALYRLDLSEYLGPYLQSLGVEKHLEPLPRLYPNPTRDRIYLDLGSATHWLDADIRLFNTRGQLVFEDSLNQPAKEWSLQEKGLPKGVYFLQFQKFSQTWTQKIILY